MSRVLDGFMLLLILLFAILIGFAYWTGLANEILLALLTAMLSVLGLIYSSSKNASQQSQARLFSEKAELYKKIFQLYHDQILTYRESASEEEYEPPKQLVEKIAELKSRLLIWGSDETIKAWLEMEDCGSSNNSDKHELIVRWGKLYSSMRKDLGHVDVVIGDRDLIGMFLNKEGRDELNQ